MKILTNSVDKLPVLVSVLLKRARAVSGLPADTPIESLMTHRPKTSGSHSAL